MVKKNLFILNMTGQTQKNSRVQRRLHARAQVHSTVSTRLGIAPIRYGVVVRASATTSPPPRNGKENKKQTNRSRQHSQTILSVTTVHHRLRAHSDKSDCRTRTCARCASCIPIFHIISMPPVPRSSSGTHRRSAHRSLSGRLLTRAS